MGNSSFYKYSFFIVLFFSFSLQLFGQKNFAVSGNSRFYCQAEFHKKNMDSIFFNFRLTKKQLQVRYIYKINIYRSKDGAKIQSLKFRSSKKKQPKKLKLSYDGRLVFAQNEEDAQLWKVQSGETIFRQSGNKNIIFAQNQPYFAIHDKSEIDIYNKNTGQLIQQFSTKRKGEITALKFEFNDQLLIAKTSKGKIILYNILRPRKTKQFIANDYKISDNQRVITTIRLRKQSVTAQQYKVTITPEKNKQGLEVGLFYFKKLKTVISSSVLQLRSQKEIKEIQSSLAPGEKLNYSPYEIIPAQCTLSPAGDYLLLAVKKGRKKCF